MNRFKTFLFALALTGTLGLGTALTGCDATGPSASATAAAADAPSGKTLFRGLLMGYGPSANLLPEIHDLPQAVEARQAPQRRALSDYALRQIEATSPDYFDAFAVEVRSGNHQRVRVALEGGAARIGEALETHPQFGLATHASASSIVGSTDEELAVAVAIWRWVVAWVEFWLPTNDFTGGFGSDAPTLQQEQLIDRIVQRLDARTTGLPAVVR